MRFFHSTDQLNKGDAKSELSTWFTGDLGGDLRHPEVAGSPESFITFGLLEKA
jgi:hypothetical protein